jgi:hypothetical protein
VNTVNWNKSEFAGIRKTGIKIKIAKIIKTKVIKAIK